MPDDTADNSFPPPQTPPDVVFERITDAFIALDHQWRYVYVNRKAAQNFGMTSDEMVGRSIWELFPEAIGGPFYKACHQAAKDQQPCDVLQYASAEQRWLANRIFPSPEGLSVFFQDVTEQKRIEHDLRLSERRYRSLVRATAQLTWRVPVDGQTPRDDNDWIAFTGQAPEEVIGDGWLNALHSEDRDQTSAAWEAAQSSGDTYVAAFRLRRADGVWRDMLERGVPLRDEAGQITEWVGISIDQTEQKQAERQLQELSTLQRAILDSADHSIISADTHYIIQTFNPAAERMLGYKAEEVIGILPVRQLHDPAEIIRRAREMSEIVGKPVAAGFEVFDIATQRGLPQEREWTYIRKDGSPISISLSVTTLRDAQGTVTGSVGIARDITERKAWEAERERMLQDALERADRDPLTGLFNHAVFHQKLAHETARALAQKTPLAVAMLDMDNFKFFNTVYGHLAGDQVLRQVAQGLGDTTRPLDTLARFGGDEFALLLPGLERIGAEELAATLRERMARTLFQPPGADAPIPLSLSIGVAVIPTEAVSGVGVLRLADERLRATKSGQDALSGDTTGLVTHLSTGREGFAMLHALVSAVDAKDRYTRRHSEDTLEFALRLARHLKMDNAAQHALGTATYLHDIGLIGVPDSILRKPGVLTPDEWTAIHRHPMMGALIVGAVPGFDDVTDIIRHHHERIDGQGYPWGLRGDEIPLLARILAVADAYAAMTSDRPFRSAHAPAQARAILQQDSGTVWDAALVEAFLTSLPAER